MSSLLNFNCWPSHPGLGLAALRCLPVEDHFIGWRNNLRLRHRESMDFLQLLPKPAIKGEVRRCQLQDHLRELFRLQMHHGDLPLEGFHVRHG